MSPDGGISFQSTRPLRVDAAVLKSKALTRRHMKAFKSPEGRSEGLKNLWWFSNYQWLKKGEEKTT
jgi:hypothetical protein